MEKPVAIVDEAMLLLTFPDNIIVNTDAEHYKFWTYHVEPNGSATISYGRIGKTYTQMNKEYYSSESAKRDLKTKMKTKIREGYKPLNFKEEEI